MNDVPRDFECMVLKSAGMYGEDGECTYESVLVDMLGFIKDNLEYRSFL